jgi:hypothetical protein
MRKKNRREIGRVPFGATAAAARLHHWSPQRALVYFAWAMSALCAFGCTSSAVDKFPASAAPTSLVADPTVVTKPGGTRLSVVDALRFDGDRVSGQTKIDSAGVFIGVYEDAGGAPGRRLGQTALLPGPGTVTVDVPIAGGGGAVWVMVHGDANANNILDFPGPDTPLRSENGSIARLIKKDI